MSYIIVLIVLLLFWLMCRMAGSWYQMSVGHENGVPFVLYYKSCWTLYPSIKEFDHKKYVCKDHVSYKEKKDGYNRDIAYKEEELITFDMMSQEYTGMQKVLYCEIEQDGVRFHELEAYKNTLSMQLTLLQGAYQIEKIFNLVEEETDNED